MEKTLNLEKLTECCDKLGFTQTAIAEKLGVTRAAVSKWINGQSFPRPAELLKLGKLLGLGFQELVVSVPSENEPIVAFRRRANCKTTDLHIDQAKNRGYALANLVPYLDVDPFRGPPTLKNPSTDYAYLQALVLNLRQEMKVGEKEELGFENLIGHYQDAQAIIIPVMWGKKEKHENALHIHLPETQTTWIYLNLDVRLHDFKFWMAHELGHALTIDMLSEEDIDSAEDFADAFAGALLFPEPISSEAYQAYCEQSTNAGKINCLLDYAEEHLISPNSVYIEIQKYAEANELDFAMITGKSLFTKMAHFNKKYSYISESLFEKKPTANQFMRVTQEAFQTQFYKALGDYIDEHDPGRSTVATLLGVSPMDADAYLKALKA
jgi:transcriptional regulator with XRE-family HTH domain